MLATLPEAVTFAINPNVDNYIYVDEDVGNL